MADALVKPKKFSKLIEPPKEHIMDQQQAAPVSEESEPQKVATQKSILKAMAVNTAMFEFINEHRVEILRRARTKMLSWGLKFSDEEFNVEVSMPEKISAGPAKA